jgi:hypothetical protein
MLAILAVFNPSRRRDSAPRQSAAYSLSEQKAATRRLTPGRALMNGQAPNAQKFFASFFQKRRIFLTCQPGLTQSKAGNPRGA